MCCFQYKENSNAKATDFFAVYTSHSDYIDFVPQIESSIFRHNVYRLAKSIFVWLIQGKFCLNGNSFDFVLMNSISWVNVQYQTSESRKNDLILAPSYMVNNKIKHLIEHWIVAKLHEWISVRSFSIDVVFQSFL